MIEQSKEEIAEAMADDPEGWAEIYLRAVEVIQKNNEIIEIQKKSIAMLESRTETHH